MRRILDSNVFRSLMAIVICVGVSLGFVLIFDRVTRIDRVVPTGAVLIQYNLSKEFNSLMDQVEEAEKTILMADGTLRQIVTLSMKNKGLAPEDFGTKWKLDRECRCLVPIPQPSATPNVEPSPMTK